MTTKELAIAYAVLAYIDALERLAEETVSSGVSTTQTFSSVIDARESMVSLASSAVQAEQLRLHSTPLDPSHN